MATESKMPAYIVTMGLSCSTQFSRYDYGMNNGRLTDIGNHRIKRGPTIIQSKYCMLRKYANKIEINMQLDKTFIKPYKIDMD